jgi:GTP-binding protein
MSEKKLLTVSLVGRPNVGKSSIFNRLIKKQTAAITHNQPGVTRDRHYTYAQVTDHRDLNPKDYILVDTGGFYSYKNTANPSSISQKKLSAKDIRRQEHQAADQNAFLEVITKSALQAINESDLVILICDIREGLLPEDVALAQEIRSRKKTLWVIANKCDNAKVLDSGSLAEFFALGIKEKDLFYFSAAHGIGVEEFEEALYSFIPDEAAISNSQDKEDDDRFARVAIIGAPNSGKSTLLNRLVGEERSIVSNIPGTTVDPVSASMDLYLGKDIEHEGEDGSNRWKTLELVDTAGIRKMSGVKDNKNDVEAESIYRSLRAMTDCDLVLMVVDVLKGITHQDRRLCEIALEKGKSLIILLNKVDQLPAEIRGSEKNWKKFLDDARYDVPWSYCTVLPLSAQKGTHFKKLKEVVAQTLLQKSKKIPTGRLNNCLMQLQERNPIMIKSEGPAKILKIRYATLVKMDPPTILIFSNLEKKIPENYRRFLANGLREEFKLKNTPVHLIFRKEVKTKRGKNSDTSLEQD